MATPSLNPPQKQFSGSTNETHQRIRLDQFLVRLATNHSRAQIQEAITAGRVTIDGQVVTRPSQKLKANQQICLTLVSKPPLNALPEPMPLDIVFEDEQVVVVNKPAGLVVHPAPGHPGGTLVNGLVHRFSLNVGDPLRPGLVHRLDKDTSGLMVVAKTEQALANLANQFHHHTVERAYLALVMGNPPDQIRYDTFHGRHPVNRKQFSSTVKKGKRAVSDIQVITRFEGAALIRVTLHTGRTHQVRVHCYDHGFPLLGDPLYRPRKISPMLKSLHEQANGQLLHATHLGFTHPVQQDLRQFDTPVPNRFEQILQTLKKQPF